LELLHQVFHGGCHGELTLEGEVKVLQIYDDLVDQGVDQLALLQVHILVGAALVVIHPLGDFVDG